MPAAVLHSGWADAKEQPEAHWIGTIDSVLWFPVERYGRSHAGMVSATWRQFMDAADRQLSDGNLPIGWKQRQVFAQLLDILESAEQCVPVRYIVVRLCQE